MYADWAYDRPGAAALKRAGFTGVIRYLSTTPGKNLTISEVNEYRDADLLVHGVYESAAGRALRGYDAGQVDAQLAVRQARMLGWDEATGGAIYFAVDTDVNSPTDMDNVYSYFAGIVEVLPARYVGVYGEADVVTAVYAQRLAKYRWQTFAWSHGKHVACEIFQKGQTTVNGVLVDVNIVISDDTGAWFSVLNEATVRQIVAEELQKVLPVITSRVWSQKLANAEPPVRRLVDMQSTIVEAIPDQVGMVGNALTEARTEIGELRELVKTFITAFKPDDV